MTYHSPIWLPPKPSRAERKIPKKSSHHFVGELTFGEEIGQGQVLTFESFLEHNVALVAIYTPGVIDIREQVRVQFVNANGRVGTHYIDFLTTEQGGRRTAILVKPLFRAVKPNFRDMAARVRAAIAPDIADRLVIATERTLWGGKLERAEQYHASRFAQPALDRRVRDAVENFAGPSTIHDFLSFAEVGPDGFHATLRLIRFGILTAPIPGVLTMHSMIHREVTP